MLGRLFAYRLNERSFADLETTIGSDIAARLRPLKDKGFAGKAAFSDAVKETLGESLPKETLSAIQREARRVQPKRLARFTETTRQKYLPDSPFNPSFIDYLRLRPAFFQLWFRYRIFRLVSLRKVTGKRPVKSFASTQDGYIEDDVLPYNLGQLANFHEAHRYRTERVIRLLRILTGTLANNVKIVSIGPRNEAELLLFSLLGFPLKNITGVDLFSYSPHIQVMDMHHLQHADDSFDIYYSAYTLAYSEEVHQACAEAIRVTKDGGLIALTMTVRGVSLLSGGDENLTNGASELIKLFEPNVRHVYFQEDAEWRREHVSDSEHRYVTVVFSIDKRRGTRPRGAVA